MPGTLVLSVVLMALQPVQAAPPPAPLAAEVIAGIRIHGNHLTPDEEIVRMAGIMVGQPFEPAAMDAVRARLRQTGRFEAVEVVKRYASIADPTQIVLVIVVNEGPVRVELPDDPALPVRVVPRQGITNLMVLPLLDGEDGYGLTYGVRVSYVGVTGRRGRVSFPLTWGGRRRAGVEFDRQFASGPLTRVQVGSEITRVRNPGFDEHDTRRRLWARAERSHGPIRVGGSVGWQRVKFVGDEDDVRSVGADAAFDTRVDPVLPRNAVLLTASWTRLAFRSGAEVDRGRVEARGYLGVIGQTVLVLRALREDASAPLPPAFQPLLGGWSNLRGFAAGTAAGDTLVAGSLEVRVPLSSPLSLGRVGVSAFVDTGAVYTTAERLRDQRMRTGIGGGVWMAATVFHVGLSVAHGRGASTRVNFGAGLSF